MIGVFACLQTVTALLFYRRYVYADQWDLVPLLRSYINREQGWFAQLFEHHGDHFHSSAYLIMVPLARFTDWNLLAELLIILAISAASFVLYYSSLTRQNNNFTADLVRFPVLLMAALYFSLAHLGNMLWTWQLAVYLVIFGFSLSVFFLTFKHILWVHFVLALAGAVIATLSFSTGFAVWPVGVLLILANHNESLIKRALMSVLWCLIGLAFVLWFLQEMQGGFSQELELSFMRTTLFMLYYLGTSVSYFSRDLSLVIAGLGLFSWVYLLISTYQQAPLKYKKALIVAIALGLFSIICGLLISLGRSDLGFSQARSFRYIIFSQFFWFSLFFILWIYYEMKGAKKYPRLLSSILLIFFILILFNSQKIGRASIEKAVMDNKQMSQFREFDDQQTKQAINNLVYPPTSIARDYIQWLKQEDLNIYRK